MKMNNKLYKCIILFMYINRIAWREATLNVYLVTDNMVQWSSSLLWPYMEAVTGFKLAA